MPKFARPSQHNGRQATQQWTGDSRFATLEEALAGVSTTTAISPATMQVGNLNTLSVQGGAPILPAAGNFNFSGTPDQIVFSSTGPGQIIASLANSSVSAVVTTVGATTSALFTIPLGAIPGTYTFEIDVAAYVFAGPDSPSSLGYTLVGAVRTTGAAAVLIPGQELDAFEELPGTFPALCVLAASGNNALVNITGVVADSIRWRGTLKYIFQG